MMSPPQSMAAEPELMNRNRLSRFSRAAAAVFRPFLVPGQAAFSDAPEGGTRVDDSSSLRFRLCLPVGQLYMTGPGRLPGSEGESFRIFKDSLHQKNGRAKMGAGLGISFFREIFKIDAGIIIGLVRRAFSSRLPSAPHGHE